MIFLFAGAAAVIAAAGAGTAVILKWRACAKESVPPEIVVRPEAPKESVPIAGRIVYDLKVKTPWGRELVRAEGVPGAGAQLAGEPHPVIESRGWGTLLWSVPFVLQPYRTGDIPAGSASLTFEGGPESAQTVSAVLPAFKAVGSGEIADGKLALAGKILQAERRGAWRFILIGTVLAAVLLALVWFFTRRRKDRLRELAPWERALLSIGGLRSDLHGGKATPEKAVIELTDVVRGYLEERFRLRAEHQTTPEFMRELRADSSPLDVEQREFLREFLTSADMVKFAKVPADEPLFDHAAGKAETLVRSTAADENGKEALP